MNFPRYERYKESGVDWLGKVPEHWSTQRLRFLFAIKKRIIGELGPAILSITQQGIKAKDIESNDGQLSLDYSKYQIVEPGDFAMNHMDLLTGFVDISSMFGVTSPDYRVFSIRKEANINPRYMLYVLQNAYREKIFYAYGQGASHFGRWRLPKEQFNDFVAPVPPVPEQEKISTLLDQKTTKIDALIEEQQRLIDSLSLRIEHFVLTAQNSGCFPASRIRHVVEVINRPIRLDSTETYTPLGLYNRGRGLFHKEPKVGSEMGDSDFFGVETGDLVISGQFAWEGAVALAGDSESGCVVSHRYPILRGLDGTLLTEYLLALLLTSHGRFLLNENSRGAAGRNRPLNLDLLLKEKIRVPSMDVQQDIAQMIHRRIAILKEIARQRLLLSERRSVLISAAVTGKINVATQAAKPVQSTWSVDFARPVLGAEILSRCNGPHMGRTKLQKLVHLTEYHAQISEIHGNYQRQAAGPYDPQVMDDIRTGLLQQHWFEEYEDGKGFRYRALEKAGEHKQHLPHWKDKQGKIDQILNLLRDATRERCEIVSTLYAAWNDLLLEGKAPTDDEIISDASSAKSWHEKKELIATDKWPKELKWMRKNGLVPVGYGAHTTHQPDLFKGKSHELA